MILVELGEHAFKREFAACDLQALDEIAGAHERHAPSVLDECEPDGGSQVALAAAGRPNNKRLAPFSSQLSPAVSAVTCALLTIGTASKSKLVSVLPTGSRASAR
jgi:hypothetical protein